MDGNAVVVATDHDECGELNPVALCDRMDGDVAVDTPTMFTDDILSIVVKVPDRKSVC